MWAHKKVLAIVAVIVIALAGIYFWKKSHDTSPTQAEVVTTTASGTTETKTVDANSQGLAFVRKVAGSVELSNAAGSAEAKANDALNVGDKVATKENSEAEIVFADNSVVRLAANSTLAISASSASGTDLQLDNGEVWARILKPLGDSSLFTIKTTDLSAGVRGTSVRLKKSDKGSSVDVIDSVSAKGNEAVSVSYGTGSDTKEVKLAAEEHVDLTGSGKLEKKTLDIPKVLQEDEFVRMNTKRDLVYMDELAKQMEEKAKTDAEIKAKLDKVNGEIQQSLPKNAEMGAFFDSSAIKEHMTNISPTVDDFQMEMMDAVKDDTQLSEKKIELDRARNTSVSPADAAAHQQEINQLENEIRNFDSDWKKKKADEAAASDKEKADAAAQIDKIEGDRTPNAPRATTVSATTNTPTPVTPKPTTTNTAVKTTTTTSTRPALSGSATISKPATPRVTVSGSATIR